MEWIELVLRLGLATLIGAAIGLNRDLHGKPTGVRTLGLVGLGAALVVVVAATDWGAPNAADVGAISRVIQGVLAGIGFLGAGVIMRNADTPQIHGLTTAACVWLTACLGIVCGVAAWRAFIVAVPIVFIVLVFGGPIERAVHKFYSPKLDD